MKRAPPLYVWVASALLVVAGCEASAPEPAAERRSTERRPAMPAASTSEPAARDAAAGCSIELCAPYRCDARFDRCRTTCASSGDCIDGYLCDGGFCVGSECTEHTAASRCGGYACVRGRCAEDCALGPCGDGFYCRGDTNECVRVCVTRDDAVCGGYLCDVEVGECESYCFDGELECAPNFVCSATDQCQPAIDAGSDDAGSRR